MSRTYLARLHYDGSRFAGWQRQPDVRSVQAEVERVLERLCGRRTVAHAAGRTDAGVHAIGMGVSCTVPARWTAGELRRALNALLPADCWVEAVFPMQPGFHARKSAEGRRYRYDIGTDEAAASPFRRPFEWALGRSLDFSALVAAARHFHGEHDCRAFAVKGAPKPHYHCRFAVVQWERRPGDRGVSLHVAADRFLHHMVRMMVGTMADIGLGRRPVEDIPRLLARPDNADTSPPAPPQGLYFVEASYPAHLYAERYEVA